MYHKEYCQSIRASIKQLRDPDALLPPRPRSLLAHHSVPLEVVEHFDALYQLKRSALAAHELEGALAKVLEDPALQPDALSSFPGRRGGQSAHAPY